ncbi:IclR family transcriptional regulator [Glycomyces xiaoerkulensis]|uniref:IclR family transcriptional regulator n=1 Tax=Glycomyces xiaoerkulensis TaxID=2038139 RepID=UPI000C256CF6|nr:IclR family transcriptional regulator C-terminal domain-containing protein [Glycomyces xiaoerkulensis]
MVEQRRPRYERRKHGGIRPGSKEQPTKLIQSVRRALHIMEFVGQYREGVSAQRIAFECRLNRGTAYNLLRTLVYERYLRRDDEGRYTLGLEVSDRYSELTQAMAGPRSAEEFMRRMSAETGYSTYVARFVEGRPAVTGVAEGARSPHVEDLIVGFDDGAHATALGKALLATLPHFERALYLRAAGMRRFTRRTLTEPAALEHDLVVADESGVFTEFGQFQEGVACGAVVARDHPEPAERVVLAAAMPLSEAGRSWPEVTWRLRLAAAELEPLLD